MSGQVDSKGGQDETLLAEHGKCETRSFDSGLGWKGEQKWRPHPLRLVALWFHD